MNDGSRLAYLDRSAWASLIRDEESGGDAIPRLRRSVKTKKTSLVVGDVVLDETLPVLTIPAEDGARHVALLVELADWKRGLVLLPKDLVRGQALAVLENREAPPAFSSAYRTLGLMKRCSKLARRDRVEFEARISVVGKRKAEFEAAVRLHYDRMRVMKQSASGPEPELATFIEEHAPQSIRDLLEDLGVGPVSDEDARRVLVAPAPRMYAAVHIAYVYYQVFRGRKWEPDQGDGYDLLHAVAATAADEFVSDEGRLRVLANAGSLEDFAVQSLPEFVQSLES